MANDLVGGGGQRHDADYYDRLAERAHRRFELERKVQWCNAAGLWAMFGGGAAVLLLSDGWAPSLSAAFFATLFAVVVVALYAVWYLPKRLRKLHRDNEVAFWWDTNIQRSLGNVHLPPELEPGPGWPSAVGGAPASAAEEPVAAEVAGPPTPRPDGVPRRWYALQLVTNVELAITLAFAVLFVAAAWSRWSYEDVRGPRGLNLEGQNVQIETLRFGER